MCLLPLVGGCGQTAVLALKFTPQDSSTYRLIIEDQKIVEIEGDISSRTAEGGRAVRRVEMEFAQQIETVDDQGNSTARITINELKYFHKVKEDTKTDFDSTAEERNRGPLGRLIGQSYTIEISPSGKVTSIVDIGKARAAVRGGTPDHIEAKGLLNSKVIKARHAIPALPAADKNRLDAGESWSNVKNFSYGMMGSDTYERVYTLKKIKESRGHRIALVEMNAIPSSEMATELHKEQPAGSFPGEFDSTKTYTGHLKLDLTVGKVDEYFEKLQTRRVVISQAPETGNEPPPVLKLGVIRLYNLERID
jgi:hypothetical protein